MAILKKCWDEGDHSFKGEFYECGDFAFDPKPVQRPHLPIRFGGNDDRTLEEVVKFGDGWHPITSAKRPGSTHRTLADFEERIARLRGLAETAGRDPAEIAASLHAPSASTSTAAFSIPASI